VMFGLPQNTSPSAGYHMPASLVPIVAPLHVPFFGYGLPNAGPRNSRLDVPGGDGGDRRGRNGESIRQCPMNMSI